MVLQCFQHLPLQEGRSGWNNGLIGNMGNNNCLMESKQTLADTAIKQKDPLIGIYVCAKWGGTKSRTDCEKTLELIKRRALKVYHN